MWNIIQCNIHLNFRIVILSFPMHIRPFTCGIGDYFLNFICYWCFTLPYVYINYNIFKSEIIWETNLHWNGIQYFQLYRSYTGWPKKNATTFIPNFNDILDWMPLICYCIRENIRFQIIWHQVHQVWIMRFDYRAIFLRQCHFQNVLLFPRACRLEAAGFFFSSDGIPLCWQKHNCPHFEKEDNMNETQAFIMQLLV